ncbi:Ethanolamine-phosphate phospho-lyase [Geodia barretti]|uniref:Ethanolamine-phosphate phospho-lyase n=1 Tax=Geodia barretti TaxID=519541 RepID=A0AA35WHP7_GEOBA|nr:Ethanolamine-phosphate phospho-lyase [Geodia barretti]
MEERQVSRKEERGAEKSAIEEQESAANEGKMAVSYALFASHVYINCLLCLRSPRDSGEVHFVRGEKQYLFDEKGQKYLDIGNSTPHVGHCHPTVVSVAARQMAELNTNTRFINDRMITFAEKLTSSLPDPLSKCIFVNSRSEANDLALRIAEVATGHTHAISITGCYHGHLQSLTALRGDYPSSDCSQAPTPDMYRGKYRDIETAARQYAGEVQHIIDRQTADGKHISCFIHETVLTHAGMIHLPRGYLPAVYKSAETLALCMPSSKQNQTALKLFGNCTALKRVGARQEWCVYAGEAESGLERLGDGILGIRPQEWFQIS